MQLEQTTNCMDACVLVAVIAFQPHSHLTIANSGFSAKPAVHCSDKCRPQTASFVTADAVVIKTLKQLQRHDMTAATSVFLCSS